MLLSLVSVFQQQGLAWAFDYLTNERSRKAAGLIRRATLNASAGKRHFEAGSH